MAAQRRNLRRLAVVVLVLLVLGGGAWTFARHLARDSLADAATVELPPRERDYSAVHSFFQGAGAPLLVVLEQTRDLPVEPAVQSCTELAVELDRIGTPDALLNSAMTLQDVDMRDATVNHLDAVADYLNECGVSTEVRKRAERAEFTATVWERMLIRAGVR